jgi:hypothetical protein
MRETENLEHIALKGIDDWNSHLIHNVMTSNTRLSIEVSLSSIALIGWMSVPAVNAQPSSPAPKTTSSPSQATSQQPKQHGYSGIGGAIGIGSGQSTALGTGGLSLPSKIVFSDNLSIHGNSVVFGSSIPASSYDLTFNLPLVNKTSSILLVPFLGGGIMTRNQDGTSISPHLIGGIDIGMSENLTVTVRVEAGFVNGRSADVGLIVGVGLNK